MKNIFNILISYIFYYKEIHTVITSHNWWNIGDVVKYNNKYYFVLKKNRKFKKATYHHLIENKWLKF